MNEMNERMNEINEQVHQILFPDSMKEHIVIGQNYKGEQLVLACIEFQKGWKWMWKRTHTGGAFRFPSLTGAKSAANLAEGSYWEEVNPDTISYIPSNKPYIPDYIGDIKVVIKTMTEQFNATDFDVQKVKSHYSVAFYQKNHKQKMYNVIRGFSKISLEMAFFRALLRAIEFKHGI